MNDDIESILDRAFSHGEDRTDKPNPYKDYLTEVIDRSSLKSVVQLLEAIAMEKDQQQPYLEWAKDAHLLHAISIYLEN